MIKTIFLLSFLLTIAPALSAQDCHCTEEFQFVKGYMEKNYAGFRDKVTPDTREIGRASCRERVFALV